MKLKDRLFLFIFAILAFGALTSSAQAQLFSFANREQVGSLPQGRFLVSYLNSQVAMDSWYNQDGVREPLSARFGRTVSWKQVYEADPLRANQLKGLLQSYGVNLESSPGQLQGSLQGNVASQVPILGYGITNNLMMVMTIPVVRFQVASDYLFTPSASMKSFLNELSTNAQNSVAAEFEKSFQNSLEVLLAKYGYEWRPLVDKSMLGDLRADFMWVPNGLNQSSSIKVAVSPHVIFPTAQAPDLSEMFGFRAGLGRFGIGTRALTDFSLNSRVSTTVSLGGTYLFSRSEAVRVPKTSENRLESEVDPQAEISGGAQLSARVQFKYTFPRWVGLHAGVQSQRRFADIARGSRFESVRYSWATPETDQALTHAFAGLQVNTIQPFLSGDFFLPAMFDVGVGYPLAGMSSLAEPSVQVQGSMFF